MRSFNYRAPLKKQSKKAQKEYNNSRRNFWDADPRMKVVPNKKKNHVPKEDYNEREDP